MAAPRHIVAVAVPRKLPRNFDYLLPVGCARLAPGCRVQVRFANRALVGWVVESKAESDWPTDKLLTVERVIDQAPLVPDELWQLLRWTHRYYHHPLGEVLATALPAPLRRAQAVRIEPPQAWSLTTAGRQIDPTGLRRSPRQATVLTALAERPLTLPEAPAIASSAVFKRLREKGWIEQIEQPATGPTPSASGPSLTSEQDAAVSTVQASFGGFTAHLLDGVTGSGKTEVYLRLIEQVLHHGHQALVLVPEIALTPQLLERFQSRLSAPIAALHSGQSEHERIQIWLRARAGQLAVIIGTRSAVFVPLCDPALIVVDEEHDLSFKQQDALRYSARDLAVQRARQHDIPVVLGSATPSLESLNNALSKRYGHLRLPRRPGPAVQPAVELIDLRTQRVTDALSQGLRQRIAVHLERGEQVLLFLNRRGFAPVLMCDACGWYAECDRCDARLTWHRSARRLRCHHCDRQRPVPRDCPACRSNRLGPVGAGTERLDQALQQAFPDYPVLRLDRDTTRRKGQLAAVRDRLGSGQACIVVGTQMLAKGHDFPNVTLVGVVNLDQALFSSDFRAAERAAQLLVQVAGRAGRGAKRGTVMIQTHHPEHPLFVELLRAGYNQFARDLLRERRAAGFPPFAYMALLRAEALDQALVERFLQGAHDRLGADSQQLSVYGPLPAPMERRAGRYRMQLALLSQSRGALQQALSQWLPTLYQDKAASRVRWSLDVDPQESF